MGSELKVSTALQAAHAGLSQREGGESRAEQGGRRGEGGGREQGEDERDILVPGGTTDNHGS